MDTGLLLICLISLWEMCRTSADWNLSPIRLEGLFLHNYMQNAAGKPAFLQKIHMPMRAWIG